MPSKRTTSRPASSTSAAAPRPSSASSRPDRGGRPSSRASRAGGARRAAARGSPRRGRPPVRSRARAPASRARRRPTRPRAAPCRRHATRPTATGLRQIRAHRPSTETSWVGESGRAVIEDTARPDRAEGSRRKLRRFGLAARPLCTRGDLHGAVERGVPWVNVLDVRSGFRAALNSTRVDRERGERRGGILYSSRPRRRSRRAKRLCSSTRSKPRVPEHSASRSCATAARTRRRIAVGEVTRDRERHQVVSRSYSSAMMNVPAAQAGDPLEREQLVAQVHQHRAAEDEVERPELLRASRRRSERPRARPSSRAAPWRAEARAARSVR